MLKYRLTSILGVFVFGLTLTATDATRTFAKDANAKDAKNVPEKIQSLPGLKSPAELVIDHWGIPHIYAANDHDAFYVQGWNAARDRLWQIDLWRKRGLGLLSASFGPAYLAQDEASRLLLFRGDVDAEWREFGPQAKADTEAFVAGINAYVAQILRDQAHLPLEFRLTKTRPELWQRDDVVRIRSGGLSNNVSSEVQRARVTCAAGLEFDKYRRNLSPDHTPQMPDGLDPCAVSADVLRLYALGTKAVEFAKPKERQALNQHLDTLMADASVNRQGEGSNNWVIAPSHSATGRPILANDPHRVHALPSLRYLAHINAPGLDIIGAGEPALPGITIGHNQRIAFGFTISNVDQEDLYVYDLDPADAERYRYGNGFEAITKVVESIPVRDGTAQEVTLRFTRHGPVLLHDAKAGHAYALRTVWNEPGATPYFGSMLFLRARDWKGFSQAVTHWHSPPNNHVYADIDGNIGWTIGASVPVRPNWDGLLPVPGDGRYEWAGFMDPMIFPRISNPAMGYLATANDWDLPDEFPMAKYKIGYEWASYARITRISEMLAAKPKLSLTDSMALQTDPTNAMARRLLAALPKTVPDDPAVIRALGLMKGWDYRTDINSAPAALFEIWAARHLGRAIMAELVPAHARELIGDGDTESIAAILEARPHYAVSDEQFTRVQAAVWTSLKAAFAEAESLMGAEVDSWAWGRLHHSAFKSPLSDAVDPSYAKRLNLQPMAMGGTALSVMAATYRRNDFSVTAGASIRLVMDVGNWDQSRAINSSGQSGDPDSAHYRNLGPLWNAGEYVPLAFSRAAVEAAAAHRIRLMPQ